MSGEMGMQVRFWERAIKNHANVHDTHHSPIEKEREATQRLQEKDNTIGLAE